MSVLNLFVFSLFTRDVPIELTRSMKFYQSRTLLERVLYHKPLNITLAPASKKKPQPLDRRRPITSLALINTIH